MHMATKENKNEERRKTDDRDEEQQHNERTNERRALTSIQQMAADHWSLLRFPRSHLGIPT